MWERLDASIPAVTWEHLASATTRRDFVQTGVGVGLGVGFGVAGGPGISAGVAVVATLGDVVAVTAAGDPVDAGGLEVHAAITSEVAITANRDRGTVLIPCPLIGGASYALLADCDEPMVGVVPRSPCRPADTGRSDEPTHLPGADAFRGTCGGGSVGQTSPMAERQDEAPYRPPWRRCWARPIASLTPASTTSSSAVEAVLSRPVLSTTSASGPIGPWRTVTMPTG